MAEPLVPYEHQFSIEHVGPLRHGQGGKAADTRFRGVCQCGYTTKWRKFTRALEEDRVAHLRMAQWSMPMPDGGSLDDFGLALLVLLGALVVAVILIPLLLFGVELILLGLAIAAGILGRGLLGRPWVVRATPHEDPANALTWKVVGLMRSARVIDEVTSALASGLDPSPSETAELVRTTE